MGWVLRVDDRRGWGLATRSAVTGYWLGFVREGTRRQGGQLRGEPIDLVLYAVSADEWEAGA